MMKVPGRSIKDNSLTGADLHYDSGIYDETYAYQQDEVCFWKAKFWKAKHNITPSPTNDISNAPNNKPEDWDEVEIGSGGSPQVSEEEYGYVAIWNETNGLLDSEEALHTKRGGLGADVEGQSGYIKFKNGEVHFVNLSLLPSWLANNEYLEEELVTYKKLIFKCITEHTSSNTFSQDLAYWECVSPNAKIEFQENHNFNLYTPLYKDILPSTTHLQQFTTVGTHQWQVPANINRVDVLLQGGGSGGARGRTNRSTGGVSGGSGGSGGTQRYYANYKVSQLSEITIVVPAGGIGGGSSNPTAGGTARFGTLTATGGNPPNNTTDKGGTNADYGSSGVPGGTQGGGAGAGATNNAQHGGSGKWNSITGTSICRGGGGGGASSSLYPNGNGGAGGGAPGTRGAGKGVNGTPNTGGGGGGRNSFNDDNPLSIGGDGGSGIVIVRYFETNSSWKKAKADNKATFSTYTLLEKNDDFMLLVNQGEFDCQGHDLGEEGLRYLSETDEGVLTAENNGTYYVPVLRVVDNNTLQFLNTQYDPEEMKRHLARLGNGVLHNYNKELTIFPFEHNEGKLLKVDSEGKTLEGITLETDEYATTFTNADLINGILEVNHNLNYNNLDLRLFNNNGKRIYPDAYQPKPSEENLTTLIDISSYNTIQGTWSLYLAKNNKKTYYNFDGYEHIKTIKTTQAIGNQTVNINGNDWDDIRIVAKYHNYSGDAVSISFYYNDDTSTSYRAQHIQSYNGNNVNAGTFTATAITLHSGIDGCIGEAFHQLSLKNTGGKRSAIAYRPYSYTASDFRVLQYYYEWLNTSADITSITFQGFANNCRVEIFIFGLRNKDGI